MGSGRRHCNFFFLRFIVEGGEGERERNCLRQIQHRASRGAASHDPEIMSETKSPRLKLTVLLRRPKALQVFFLPDLFISSDSYAAKHLAFTARSPPIL